MKINKPLPYELLNQSQLIYSAFAVEHNLYPSTLTVCNIDMAKFKKIIKTEYDYLSENVVYVDCIGNTDNKNTTNISITVRVHDDIFVLAGYDHTIAANSAHIYYAATHLNSDKLNKVIDLVKSCGRKKPSLKNKVHLLCFASGNFYLSPMQLSSKFKFDIDLNYNNSFAEVNNIFKKNLAKKDSSGIFLLYGPPGTGKSCYIRYLTKHIRKKFIYIPQDLVPELSSPNLIPFLTRQTNSIFIIEDAEAVLKTRKAGGNSAVSNLLNVSDGLLGDCLNVQIICSFNTELEQIDKAILRKGRLAGLYEFGPLLKDKAQALSDSLGLNKVIDKPMALADVYGSEQPDFNLREQAAVGFKK